MKSRLTRLTAPRLPRRTIRLRLTAIYAVLFLVSGAALLTITYVLVEHQAASPARAISGTGDAIIGGSGAAGRIIANPGAGGSIIPGGAPAGAPADALGGGPTFCYAAGAASVPGPAKLSQCANYFRTQAVQLQAQVATQRTDYLRTLLVGSGIALGVMTLAALALGWLVSGRVLSPLRIITRTARNISASNLHERLGLGGPDDELKELGDTVDGLLARLEGSFTAQRQFVANASHELRTPLARQRTLIEVALADPARSVESLEGACQRALAAGQQQEWLIEALLTLARSQRGLDQFEPVDLAALAQEMVLSRLADAHQRGIQVTVAASPAVFPGDAGLAERLITNLLDNAVRHNRPGGHVMVRTAAESGQAVLSVTNTGPVIDPAEVSGLFEPFRHRGATRASGGGSPGLGLSIVSAIAAAHGAGVWVWPLPEGGLEIHVRFPCQPDMIGMTGCAGSSVFA